MSYLIIRHIFDLINTYLLMLASIAHDTNSRLHIKTIKTTHS
jgi:hypothetical protein